MINNSFLLAPRLNFLSLFAIRLYYSFYNLIYKVMDFFKIEQYFVRF